MGTHMAELTPMMRQYFSIKEQYPDTLLFFRLGDFYEMFFEDAKIASAELELVLTGRDCGQQERAPMCGVPYHSADGYIAKLVEKGYKVAICEQTEDPAAAKGLVRRDVLRVLTPGTVIESNMLDDGKNNYLAVIACDAQHAGLCFVDVSTGSLLATALSQPNLEEKINNELGRYSPSEVLYTQALTNLQKVCGFISARLSAVAQQLGEASFTVDADALQAQFGECAQGLLQAEQPFAAQAVCAALQYLKETQKTNLDNIREIACYTDATFMKLDVATLRNLEIVQTMRTQEKRGSLLWVLDRTRTSMGKRLLRAWLEQPLVQLAPIVKRHNAVGELVDSAPLREDLLQQLAGMQDMERLITRITYGTANARELRSLAQTLEKLPAIKQLTAGTAIKQLTAGTHSALLQGLHASLDELQDVCSLINSAICEEPPFTVREGGMITDGFHAELDELRKIVGDNKSFIADIQQREQEKTGIKKLKIGYNRVFGYYIEVTNSYKELVPQSYIRKQTLANCERYITQELKDLEEKVLGAQERIVRLEFEIFEQIRKKVAAELTRIQNTAHAVAQLDALCSFAVVAVENQYTCPQMLPGDAVHIEEGRHPVVEKMLKTPFVPNDTTLNCAQNRCAIITGPNMAGKSTYMRQVALICLMAQAGSFVPAKRAELCVVDSIFTRIGASDDLAAGQSTFMVEMQEVAQILARATKNSLIIFDEIGRGTSTYDGMSLARAVLEYTVSAKQLGAKTLFATHYHELTELEGQIDGVKNYNIAVKKRGDDITFLRRIVRGGADGSYGIEVAKLAGVPTAVVARAKVVLKELEDTGYTRFYPQPRSAEQIEDAQQISFTVDAKEGLLTTLRALDVNTLTPIEALGTLFDLVKSAQELE